MRWLWVGREERRCEVSGLKWERSLMGRTSRAEVGPITAYALTGAECVDDLIFESEAPTLDEAESLAEAKLRETYDALREHFDPVPVLRWETTANGGRMAMFGAWLIEADAAGWRLVSTLQAGKPRLVAAGLARAETIEAKQRTAVLALRALGVAFRVEGA